MEVRDWNEETNDGKGWHATTTTCSYCGIYVVHVYPAGIDPRTLPCCHCGLSEIDPEAKN